MTTTMLLCGTALAASSPFDAIAQGNVTKLIHLKGGRLDPRNGRPHDEVRAAELWHGLVETAHMHPAQEVVQNFIAFSTQNSIGFEMPRGINCTNGDVNGEIRKLVARILLTENYRIQAGFMFEAYKAMAQNNDYNFTTPLVSEDWDKCMLRMLRKIDMPSHSTIANFARLSELVLSTRINLNETTISSDEKETILRATRQTLDRYNMAARGSDIRRLCAIFHVTENTYDTRARNGNSQPRSHVTNQPTHQGGCCGL